MNSAEEILRRTRILRYVQNHSLLNISQYLTVVHMLNGEIAVNDHQVMVEVAQEIQSLNSLMNNKRGKLKRNIFTVRVSVINDYLEAWAGDGLVLYYNIQLAIIIERQHPRYSFLALQKLLNSRLSSDEYKHIVQWYTTDVVNVKGEEQSSQINFGHGATRERQLQKMDLGVERKNLMLISLLEL